MRIAWFERFYTAFGIIVFILVALRSYFIPLSHDEAATFFLYVQNDNYMPFFAYSYTNNHVLNSACTQLAYSVFGNHPFVLRLPSLLALLVMFIGIYKHAQLMSSPTAKCLLAILLLMSPAILDFFSLSRGYSYSIAFLTLATAMYLKWLKSGALNGLIGFMCFMQLALAANLIFVTVIAVFLSSIIFIQFKNKTLFNWKSLTLHIVNAALYLYWVAVSLHYKASGVLDYGVGENYWAVTFKTLIWLLTGSEWLIIQLPFILMGCIICLGALYQIYKARFKWLSFLTPATLFSLIFVGLILAFWIQKKVLDVNYPEDRTGLFFYVILVLAFTHGINEWKYKPITLLGCLFACFSLLNVVTRISLNDFSNYLYHTIPNHIYQTLLNEQSGQQVYTIGGHRIREMDFAYMNYRAGALLNPMDEREEMQMNCDYYFATIDEAPCYNKYYVAIDTDLVWNRVLLKRKEPIRRITIDSTSVVNIINNDAEYNDLWIIRDTSIGTQPIEAKVDLTFEEVPAPLKANLVLSAEDTNGVVFYRRIYLNWLSDDLNKQRKTLVITGANLPARLSKLALYCWNIDKKPIKIKVNQVTIHQLYGEGVNYTIPESYYLTLEKITKKPRL